MYKNIIKLYILSFDIVTKEKYFISTKEDEYIVPQIDLDTYNNTTIEDYCQTLFETYIDLGFDWVKTRLINIEKNDQEISICYVCTIPFRTSLKNAYYIDSSIAMLDPLATKALIYV